MAGKEKPFDKSWYEVQSRYEKSDGTVIWQRCFDASSNFKRKTLAEARAFSKSLKERSRVERVGMITVDTGIDFSKAKHRIVKVERELVEQDA